MNPHKIKFTDGVEFECKNQPKSIIKNTRGQTRDCLIITTGETYQNVKNRFIDGVQFSVLAYEELMNVSGLPSREFGYVEYEKHDYIIAGEITDNRDGTMTVIIGKKTEIEILEDENALLLFENLTGEVF